MRGPLKPLNTIMVWEGRVSETGKKTQSFGQLHSTHTSVFFFSPDRRELISRNFRRVFCFCTSGKTPPQKFEFIYFTKVCLSIYETKIFIVNYRYIYLIKKIVNYLWAKFEQKRSYIRVILPKRVMVPEIKSWHNLISTVSPPKIGNKSTFEL